MELGSEFDLSFEKITKKENNLYQYLESYMVQWYDSARSAIRTIAYDSGKTVLLPEYICESVIRCFEKSRIIFYHIDDKFDIDEQDLFSKLNDSVGVVYICHYYGFLQDVNLLKEIYHKVTRVGALMIEDTTQSFFSGQKLIGDVGVMSIRKWMPVSQGGILYAEKTGVLDEENYLKLGKSNQDERALGMFLKGIFLKNLCDTNRVYRDIFERYEDRLDKQVVVEKMSDLARLQIECVDIPNMIRKRKENEKYLSDALQSMNISLIRCYSEGECPFALPLRVRKRDLFRKYLLENHVYCAVHWPTDSFMVPERKQAKDNAEQLISLPIDQRYGRDEMDYMIDIIKRYGRTLTF